MPVLVGSPSLVLASQVQVYQTCSVDLTWQRAIHSCQRCPRAVLVASSVSLPPITESNVERTTSRFCPAGVHMSTCVPASEIFTSSGRLSASRPQSAIVGNAKEASATPSHVAVSRSAINGSSEESAWGPPNLPAPAASPHHPVHAAHLSRASYPPASMTASVTPSTVTSSSTPLAKSTTSTTVHHFNPAQSGDGMELNGLPTDTLSMTSATIIPAATPLALLQVAETDKDKLLSDLQPEADDSKENVNTTVLHESKIPTSSDSGAAAQLKAELAAYDKTQKSVSPATDEKRADTLSNEERKKHGLVDVNREIESSGEPQNLEIGTAKKAKKEDLNATRFRTGSTADKRLPDGAETSSGISAHGRSIELGEDNEKTPKSTANRDASVKMVSSPTSPILPVDSVSLKQSQQQQQHILREPATDSPQQPVSPNQVVRSPSGTVGSGGVGDVSPTSRTPGKLNATGTNRTTGPVNGAPDSSSLGQPPKPLVSAGSGRKRQTIPTFYFPQGVTRMTPEEVNFEMERSRQELAVLAESPGDTNGRKTKSTSASELWIPHSSFGQVARALTCPLYWKYPIYVCSGGTKEHQPIQLSAVLRTWNQVITSCPDEAARFVHLMTRGKSTYLVQSDFNPLIQDILESHPGLAFLQEAKDFHSRYVATVVARIFFNVNASWSGRISLGELRHSNFLSVLASLEDEVDINLVTQYFSYEHFYVIYCKFWELDEDHDLIISRTDLARHNNYALSERMINRIFSGTVTRGNAFKEGMMYYHDFVWFLLAEEDKLHPRSIEYWFRCMDLDGDGVLSMYELEYFYSEQMTRIEDMGIDPISFEDCLCQCLDMVKPALHDKIILSDLKQCGLCNIFFDTFFNLPKYLQHEQRDPFTNLRDIEEGLNNVSCWDRFAAEAYEMLVAVEGDHAEDAVDDDYPDGEEDELHEVDADNRAESPGMVKENGTNSQPTVKLSELTGVGETTGTLATMETDPKNKRKRTVDVN